jgi:hypothetical protein
VIVLPMTIPHPILIDILCTDWDYLKTVTTYMLFAGNRFRVLG